MTYKEFSEDADIEYNTQVYVNGELAGEINSYSEESHLEDFRKLDHAIASELTRQYEELPENTVSEDD